MRALVWVLGYFVVALLVATHPALAQNDSCATLYLAAQLPQVQSGAVLRDDADLCYDEFAVGYSDATRTPLWSAEHLTAAQLETHVPRGKNFHPESQLAPDDQAQLADYAHTGFDRGHMSPADDESTVDAESQCFTLANMVPQDPTLNRGLWAHIEAAVRSLAKADGQLYVVTGPVFEGDGSSSKVPDGRVSVPVSIFKAVYDPKERMAGAYLATNDASGTWKLISISDLTALTGIDVFPSLVQSAEERVGELPNPEP